MRRDEADLACIDILDFSSNEPNVEPKGQPVRHNELIIWAQTSPAVELRQPVERTKR